MVLFDNDYGWYKGNLHTHTTESDGAMTPEEVIHAYWEAGYDFLALTDHDRLLPESEYRGMTVLKGTELAYNDLEHRVAWHFVAINPDEDIISPDNDWKKNPQNIIDHIKTHHGYCILGHPHWSLMTPEDILSVHGFDAVEVMNSVSDPFSRGDSSYTIDLCMKRGFPLRMVASDDAHHYTGEQCYAATWVNARSNRTEDLMEALYAGRFYASTGPRFRELKLENGRIKVLATPVKTIRFMSDAFSTKNRRVNCEMNRDYALYEFNDLDTWVRVELEDFQGRRAWSPYFRNPML